MKDSILIAWGVVLLLAVISIALLMGKASFLIAGYNTARKQEKEKYDKKRLTQVMGWGFGALTIIMAISTAFEFQLPRAIEWLIPWGIFAVIAVTFILANTVARKDKA